MSNLNFYDRGFFFADGQLLGESSGGSIEYTGDPLPVETLVKEFAGVTPVPKRATLKVDSFVPATGFEVDMIKKFLENSKVTMKLQFGGSGIAMEADGFVTAPSISFSATDQTKLSFSVMIEAKPFTGAIL